MQGVPGMHTGLAPTKTPVCHLGYRWGCSSTYLLFFLLQWHGAKPCTPLWHFQIYLTSIIWFNCTLLDSVPDGSLQWSSSFLVRAFNSDSPRQKDSGIQIGMETHPAAALRFWNRADQTGQLNLTGHMLTRPNLAFWATMLHLRGRIAAWCAQTHWKWLELTIRSIR